MQDVGKILRNYMCDHIRKRMHRNLTCTKRKKNGKRHAELSGNRPCLN